MPLRIWQCMRCCGARYSIAHNLLMLKSFFCDLCWLPISIHLSDAFGSAFLNCAWVQTFRVLDSTSMHKNTNWWTAINFHQRLHLGCSVYTKSINHIFTVEQNGWSVNKIQFNKIFINKNAFIQFIFSIIQLFVPWSVHLFEFCRSKYLNWNVLKWKYS